MNYTRKAHEVQAIRWTGDNYDEVYKWVMSWDLVDPGIRDDKEGNLHVSVMNVETYVTPGQWLVRDIPNEFFYPVSPGQFAEDYAA